MLPKTTLEDSLAKGARPASAWQVGTEYEKLAVWGPQGVPLHYAPQGDVPGIRSVLEAMGSWADWSPGEEGGSLIALTGEDGSITLEPGGQFELSGAPLATMAEMVAELDRHRADLARVSAELGVRWLWTGAHPVHGLDELGWMPKARYDIMRRYLPTRGALAHPMMKTTCTVQANFDFADERDMGEKLRTSTGLSSVVAAMFANSPFRQGRLCGFKSWRWHIWTDTDPDRCGLLPWVFDGESPSFARYVDYALEVPLFFLLRGENYIDCAGLPFGDFLRRGHEGQGATLDDWILHLSTLFPDVRLKTYLEVRSADCVAPDLLPSLPALWKGILYDDTARRAAWDLVSTWSFTERVAHRDAAARRGLQAPVPGKSYDTADVARELCAIARYGLDALATEDGESEARYLEPLEALMAARQCPADQTIAWYEEEPRDAAALHSHYAV